MSEILSSALLVAGLLCVLITAAGVVLSKDVFSRLHFLSVTTSAGAPLIAAAILMHRGFSQNGVKSALTALILFFTGPMLSHATARAARIDVAGTWHPQPGEPLRTQNTEES